MKKYPMNLLFLTVLTVFIFSGCSDNPTKTEGSLTDEEFVLMDQILNETMQNYNVETLRLALDLTDSVAEMGGAGKPLFNLHKANDDVLDITELSYTYQNYWHVYQVSAKITASAGEETDSLIMSGVDSLRFRADGTPSQYPVEDTTDEVNIRQHYNIEAYGSLGGTFDFSHHALIDITGEHFDLDIFTLAGAVSDSVEIDFEDYEGLTCDIFLNSGQSYDDVVINGELECPESGKSSVTAIVDMACSDSTGSFSADGTWTAAYTFYGDSVSVVVESGNTRWTYTEDCYGDI